MPAPIGIAPYFKDICLLQFESFLRGYGFILQNIDEIGGVIFSKEDVFIEITYLPDTTPYVSSVNIGFFEKNNHFKREIGIWYVIPNSLTDDYNLWRFNNIEELRISLCRLKDEVISIYGPLLWNNMEYLKHIVEQKETEEIIKENKNLSEEIKQKAVKAFEVGNYSEVISLYSRLNSNSFSQAELKRLKISKKYLGQKKQS